MKQEKKEEVPSVQAQMDVKPTINAKAIGGRIRQLRKEKGLTQEELAVRLNTSPNSIAKIECGLRKPSIDLLLDMVEFFETTTDFIMLGENPYEEEDRQITIQDIDLVIAQLDELREKLIQKKQQLEKIEK